MLHLDARSDPFENLADFVRALLAPTADEQRVISDAVHVGWRENFAGERSGAGQAWRPLRPYTILERTRRGYPGAHPILVQSGHMLDSLVSPGAADSYEELRTEAGGWVLLMGTNDPKAKKHELGEGRIPARPFVALSSNAKGRVLGAMDSVLDRIQARTIGR